MKTEEYFTSKWFYECTSYNEFIEKIKQYAKDKCAEQRTICSRQVSGWPDKILVESEIEENVRNANETEF